MNILKYLNENETKQIQTKRYNSKETIFYEGDLCQKVGIVLEGEIQIISYTHDKEILYNTIHKNELFGNNLIFSSDPHYKGNIITTKTTQIAYIEKEKLVNILQNNKSFLEEYLKKQSDFSKTINTKLKLLSLKTAKERIIFFLNEHNNQYQYQSINDLAAKLQLERETLSRCLHKMLKNKEIIKKGKTLILP